MILASAEASSQDEDLYENFDLYSEQIALDSVSTIVPVCEFVTHDFQLMDDVLTERQDLIASSLGLGLLLSAVGAAIVGSLVAAGLTSLTNVRVRCVASSQDNISNMSIQLLIH